LIQSAPIREEPPSDDENCADQWPLLAWPGTHGGGTRETIILKHYGPVFDGDDDYGDPDDPDTVPLVIERRSVALGICDPSPCPGDEVNWTDRTSLFDVYVPGGGSREVWVARKLEGTPTPVPVELGTQYKYKVTPAEGSSTTKLRSDWTLLPPVDAPGVRNYPYFAYVCLPSFTGGQED
jgi:hypothetical protein